MERRELTNPLVLDWSKIPATRLQATREDQTLEFFDPQRVSELSPNEAVLFGDSKNKAFGTVSDFRVDFGVEVPNIKRVALMQIQLPAIPTIHSLNDTIVFTFDGTQYTTTLAHGFYSYSNFKDVLIAALNVPAPNGPGVGSIGVIDWPQTGGFKLTAKVGSVFSFVKSSFLTQGMYVVPFQYNDPTANPPVVIPEAATVYSGIAYMLPTRYVVVKSKQLVRHGKLQNLTSNKDTEVIGVFQYNQSSNQQQVVYTVQSLNYINWLPRENFSQLDIQIFDEFKQDLSRLVPTTYIDNVAVPPVSYDLPQNSEVAVWVKVQV